MFKLDDGGKWHSAGQATLQTVAAELGVPEGVEFTGRSLAVGDVDGEGDTEIVTTANYYYATPEGNGSRTYLLVFDSSLALEGWTDFADPTIGVGDFCVGYSDSLQLAETDGDGIKEIWLAGWTNSTARYTYRQRVLAFRASDGLQLAQNWDLGLTDRLGPRIAAGHLFDSPDRKIRDQIVLSNLAQNDNSVKIYDGDQTLRWSNATWLGGVQRAYVVREWFDDGRFVDRLVVGGLMPSAKKVMKGLFLEVLDSDGATLTSGPSYGVRDDSEIWTFSVGFGIKQ